MTFRHVNTLIERVRRDSSFSSLMTTSGGTLGVSDSEIVDYFNDAQSVFVEMATGANSTVFQESLIIPLGSESVEISSTSLLMESRVVEVRYRGSPEASWSDVRKRPIHFIEDSPSSTCPKYYYLQNGQIYLTGGQLSGEVWITWERTPDYLGVPIATVSNFVASDGELSDLQVSYLSSSAGVSYSDTDWDLSDRFFNIVNRYGEIVMRNIEYNTIASGVLGFAGGRWNFLSYESLQEGDYIVCGQDRTTHSPLPKEAERFFIYYATEHVCGSRAVALEKLSFLQNRTDRALRSLESAYEIGDKDADFINFVEDDPLIDLGW